MTPRSQLYNMNVARHERELTSQNFKDFTFSDNILSQNVEETYRDRPDLFSYAIYGTSEYWWLLMKLNGVEDIWNDFKPGMILRVPSPGDMQALINHLTVTTENV